MDWLTAVGHLRERGRDGVIVTVISSRGHAPRRAGAKMVVSSTEAWDTVGGGNLEATAIQRARTLLADGLATPQLLTVQLSEKAPAEYGVQCCGGEVTMMLEPIRIRPAVAICGVGHVGLELALILSRHDVQLHLIDSREEMLSSERLAALKGGVASIHVHHSPVPESALHELPPDTHVLIMTHDHLEDLALCDMALKTPGLSSIGLIGSHSKWRRFQLHLGELGHTAEEIERITTPIGISGITAKEPAAIAVSVAARLLQMFEALAAAERATHEAALGAGQA
ncbi:xanthine dehydrogenase accessory protein XdhC [Homoserinimonas sp. OAct 916]|uniref:xanthine dehydrogenase accessory protein XdhC n=1 Tax=Homoserinimonas sp. OAct 916 TaxID=2211450 RepID=UPI000DBE6C9D|nr:xanthine dehydrogenase accessory protein XdhC [Homoserinimonas sp. OAct 916]